MKKALVKYRFPWWRVLVYNTYKDTEHAYMMPDKFFSKMKAKKLASWVRGLNLELS